MSADVRTQVTPEILDWYRSSALAGVEVINARNSSREVRVVTPAYGLVLFPTWRGRIRTRGKQYIGQPGTAFCMMPDEPIAARPHDEPGEFVALEIAPEALSAWLSEHGHSGHPEWAAVVKTIGPEFRARFARFFRAFAERASALEHQTRAAELTEQILHELVVVRRTPAPRDNSPARAERMRAYLHEHPDADLEALARVMGMNRFQALRAFKRRYGLPPHAYQLCKRLSEARILLLAGLNVTEAALQAGFSDQSHFIRHFTRVHGITPQQYARFHELPRRALRGQERIRAVESVVSSADRPVIRRLLTRGAP